MRSVLIVDDEYYIRVRVRKCVDWQALGFAEVVDCDNGQEALDLLGTRPFDLAVVDISMPIMDGLALCKKMRQLGHDTQVILLTGYDKFEYAKLALSYDVVEYVLKPVDGEEMERAIEKACRRIEKNASLLDQLRQSEALKSQADKLKRALFFGSIFSDSYLAHPAASAQLQSYGLRADTRYAVIYTQAQEASVPETHAGCVLEVRLAKGQVWVVTEAMLGDVLRELRQAFKQGHYGVSALHPGTPKALHTAYREARFVHCQRLLSPLGRVFCLSDHVGAQDHSCAEALKGYRDAFGVALRARALPDAQAILAEAFACLVEGQGSVLDAYRFTRGVLLDIQRGDAPLGDAWDEAVPFEMQALEMLQGSDALSDLTDQLVKVMAQYISSAPKAASGAGAVMARRVRQLVEAHYMEASLSPSAIAQALSLNASYLSDAFRRHSGQTLSQYINQVRMEKAGALLSDERMSLVDVMERVGYKDPYYFSKRFKKFFGCSPAAYRANG